jgi:nicotinamide-nucleotide adenylyltransferase/phosphinothricin biosynthesis protein PhpF
VNPITDTGVVHGRLQPLHLGHLEYLLAGQEACEHLVVGITNPDPTAVVVEPTQPDRHLPASNPFTYYERYLMAEAALVGAGIGRDRFRIVPFPHSRPELLPNYVPPDAMHFLTVYDDWGEEKLRRLGDLGMKTHVLWRRTHKVTTGTEIRRRIAAGQPWHHLVPPGVAAVLTERGIAERMRHG